MHKNNSSPRSSLSGDEEVFDFPGVEDESSGSNPPSREAHLALKEGMDIGMDMVLLYPQKNVSHSSDATPQYELLSVMFPQGSCEVKLGMVIGVILLPLFKVTVLLAQSFVF